MLNRCQFIGNLGANPTVRQTETGTKVAMFNIAVEERGYKKKDGTEVPKRIEWIPLVLWGGLAETAEKYLQKGAKVYVEGKFRTRSYEKDGVTFFRTEVYAENLLMLGHKSENIAPLPPEPDKVTSSEPAESDMPEDDDLPF